jgi:hypothetical protein
MGKIDLNNLIASPQEQTKVNGTAHVAQSDVTTAYDDISCILVLAWMEETYLSTHSDPFNRRHVQKIYLDSSVELNTCKTLNSPFLYVAWVNYKV